MSTRPKFMVIDGNSLIHRAFYAIPLLSTREGVYTNAVYGFTNMLLKVVAEQRPDHVAVAFDLGKPVFRVEQYQAYKAHRKATPDELRPQFNVVKEVLRSLNVAIFEVEGYEADDVIGTLTNMAEKEGWESLIVTGDRDSLQLVSPLTKAMLTKKGITELEIYDVEKVWERYGLTPAQVVDFKGLTGDPSDNIPGVPGVGEKTALKLLHQYGTLEEVLAHLEEIAGKLRETLRNNVEIARTSKELATIVRDVPLEEDLTCCRKEEPDWGRVLTLAKELEFKALAKTAIEKLSGQGGVAEEASVDTGDAGSEENEAGGRTAVVSTAEMDYRMLESAEDLALFEREAAEADWLHIGYRGTVSNAMLAELQGLALSARPGRAVYIEGPLAGNLLEKPGVPWERAAEFLNNVFLACGLKYSCHDAKGLMVLLDKYGIRPRTPDFDTMLAAYLLNPGGKNQDLGDLVLTYLDEALAPEENYRDTCARADYTGRLGEVLAGKVQKDGLEDLFRRVEMPLTRVLADMEIAGVAVDVSRLRTMSREMGEVVARLTEQIYNMAGETFNINSPKQLGYILFEKLNLPVIKKTKTGYSTDAEVLEQLAEIHEMVAKLLDYRQLVKLKSTYVDGLMGLINPRTGKIHTTFNQTVTATGRLSSTEPNLQNIPIRMEEGRKIRQVFVPEKAICPGGARDGRASNESQIILGADYSQIELRILAHLSGDENLREAFREGQDIHTRTASEVFGVPLDRVTRDMRRAAKAVNFGIIYGISDFGLSRDIKVGRREAKEYIESYFARYPGVKEYIDRTVVQARETGYVTTVLNRRRYLPDITSSNRAVRNFGERTAMNTPIQGSAADIIKLAMLDVDKALKERELATKMLLQVHDELIFQVPAGELEEVAGLVKNLMEKAYPLDVPVVVDLKAGPNWYAVEKIG